MAEAAKTPDDRPPQRPTAEDAEPGKKEHADALLKAAIAALNSKGVSKDCPRCNTDQWTLQELSLLVSSDPTVFQLPPPTIEALVLRCANCAFISIHDKRILGLKK
jgi:hypothetical protein